MLILYTCITIHTVYSSESLLHTLDIFLIICTIHLTSYTVNRPAGRTRKYIGFRPFIHVINNIIIAYEYNTLYKNKSIINNLQSDLCIYK